MPLKLLELRPNRDLLNSNFDGYKLSLESVQNYKLDVQVPVDKVCPSKDQYSLLHTKLFGLHNHLVGESINGSEYIYYIDQNRFINKTNFNSNTIKFEDIFKVWEVPINKHRELGDYNMSFKIASDDLIVLSDGIGTLYILQTGNRELNQTWYNIFSEEVLGSKKSFVIENVICKKTESKLQLHCLLQNINKDDSEEYFSTLIYWVTISKIDGNAWGQTSIKELKVDGCVYYIYLEPSCDAIYVASDKGVKFILDSDNPVVEKKDSDVKAVKKYAWSQTHEDVTLKIKLPADFNKSDLVINTTNNTVSVKYRNSTILSGDFYQRVNCGITTWTIGQEVLEIVFMKLAVGLMWPEMLINNDEGEYLIDVNLAADIHDKLSHLCSDSTIIPETGTTFNSQQVEECDFEEDKGAVFERLCSSSHKVTHKINISSHRVLFTKQLAKDIPPALALRHDVDACLWQPEGTGEQFNLKHIGTLFAYGYVQASKQQRKYSTCSPDLGYSVVCESSRHMFVYQQNKAIENTRLRNRTTGCQITTVAQQQVINIVDEILGIYAGLTLLFVLNKDSISAFKI